MNISIDNYYNLALQTIPNTSTDNSLDNSSQKRNKAVSRVADKVEISSSGKKLSDDEKREVEELKKTDKEVKAHEQAHLAAGAGVTKGGPHYEYKKGPDGQVYAVGGEVSIDTSEGRTPSETISKMERVRAAATAPANPSGQDMKVAAEAGSKASEARMELANKVNDKGPDSKEKKGSNIDILA